MKGLGSKGRGKGVKGKGNGIILTLILRRGHFLKKKEQYRKKGTKIRKVTRIGRGEERLKDFCKRMSYQFR